MNIKFVSFFGVTADKGVQKRNPSEGMYTIELKVSYNASFLYIYKKLKLFTTIFIIIQF